jgi:hypothetical protein
MVHSNILLLININGNNHNKYKMVLSIMDNGKIIKEMEEENKYGEMALFIKEYF